jgi:hypothetical protein
MNSPQLLLFSLIALMVLSSLGCLLLVSIQNSRAVKKYYQTNQISDIELEEEVDTPRSPVFSTYGTKGYSIAS